jgi:diadenosine tetraphosphate (Ap4A) HIT family hydrolase
MAAQLRGTKVVVDRTRCPFCQRIEAEDVRAANPLACAFDDAYPISPGHTLIVSRRHEPDFFALTSEEQAAMLALVRVLQPQLKEQLNAQAFNIGLNVGAVAGQTVGHAHLHLVPRFEGDVQDPRGGIRWIIPEKAAYWHR